jgi:hypothetical protein
LLKLVLVMLVASAKKLKAIASSRHKTKQSGRQGRQVYKADMADKAVRPVYFVLCPLLAPLCFEVDVLLTNMCGTIFFL